MLVYVLIAVIQSALASPLEWPAALACASLSGALALPLSFVTEWLAVGDEESHLEDPVSHSPRSPPQNCLIYFKLLVFNVLSKNTLIT